MLKKSERTVDLYIQAGTYIKLLKELFVETALTVSKVVPSKKYDSFNRKVDMALMDISSFVEECMFSDHDDKGLPFNPIHVFYGGFRCGDDDAQRATNAKAIEYLEKMANQIKNIENKEAKQ